ncbi:MAG: hypothetical protein CM1200mP9_04620 [Gammaproteobacteria bacterium]|nr:MAG: hypothetical protein CM1200mP9_04620 [Gammaproteobacteria bacterium]
MTIHVLGRADGDINTLYDLVEQQIAPRFASVAGVSQAQPNGGAGGKSRARSIRTGRVRSVSPPTQSVTRYDGTWVGKSLWVGSRLRAGVRS